MSATALGIDLGTTFSVVAQVNQNGEPVVLPNAEGSPTTPSAVLFDGDSIVVGSVAREALASEPESVVQLVKRQMGTEWTFEYCGVPYRAEHISSLILRKVMADAQQLAGSVDQAVITVPAYFNDAMRLATRRAGELAGIDVIGLLSEPTAAAIAFGYDQRPEHKNGVVIDLGGGTFDVTVMRYEGSDLVVKATGGDHYLGGANFDKVLFDLFVEEFRRSQGLDINDPDSLSIEDFAQVSQDWLMRANRAKLDLSVRERTTVALQAIGLSTRLEVERRQFMELSRVLLDEMSERLLDVLRSAGMSAKDIDVVLAVGGSTRLPMVRDRVKELLGVDLETAVRPDEAVALGAAVYAARLQVEQGGALMMDEKSRQFLEKLTVTDVGAHSLGVSVYSDSTTNGGQRVMQVILSRNTPLPCTGSCTFYTMRPDETRIVIPVLEGEEREADLASRIGEVIIDDLPPGRPANQPVEVVMTYDRDGILEVMASDVNTGREVTTTIKRVGQTDEGAAEQAVRSLRLA